MATSSTLEQLVVDYPHQTIGCSAVVEANCFEWMSRLPENSLHSIVTDPPYGVKEYELDQIKKREDGHGGIWRLPPAYDGHERSPLPRFTALSPKELDQLRQFFNVWASLSVRCLRPGGHVFIASNSYLSQWVFSALVAGGLEFRGQVIRMVQTLRGGDRPKNAEKEFPDVSSLPKGGYEPWGVFRKPMPKGMRLSDCLKEFQTGGIRRSIDGKPFSDVIQSERTPQRERDIAPHPSLKPQSFLRKIVYVSLPLGEGVIADPFMGSGSTVAAAEAMKLSCIGVERHSDYYQMALDAIPKLKTIIPRNLEVLQTAQEDQLSLFGADSDL